MKKNLMIASVCLVLLMSLSIVSAGWFTGEVVKEIKNGGEINVYDGEGREIKIDGNTIELKNVVINGEDGMRTKNYINSEIAGGLQLYQEGISNTYTDHRQGKSFKFTLIKLDKAWWNGKYRARLKIGVSDSSVIGGDAVLLEKLSNKFNLGDSIKDVFTGHVDDSDMPNTLKDATYKYGEGKSFNYEQKILLGDLVLSEFRDVDYEDLMGLPYKTNVIGIKLPANTLVLEYSLDFTRNLAFTDLDRKLFLLGKEYILEDVELGKGFNLVSGKDRITLEDGKKIRINGKVIDEVKAFLVKGANGELSEIKIEWLTDSEHFLTPETDSLVMPGFETLKFDLGGIITDDIEEGTYGELYLIGGDFTTDTWRC